MDKKANYYVSAQQGREDSNSAESAQMWLCRVTNRGTDNEAVSQRGITLYPLPSCNTRVPEHSGIA